MKKGKPLSVSYKTKDAQRYSTYFAEYVTEEVSKQDWTLEPNSTQHFYIDTTFYFPRTDMDPNNYFKVMIDAITDTKLIWLDDNVTCERVNGIYYDSENPRVELHIHPVDYIGIFDNAAKLDEFKSNCIGCRYSTRNCSVLSRAILGHVSKDIANNQCLKRIELKEKRKNAEKESN